MNGKKDISTFNRRVTIKQWMIRQDEALGSYYEPEPRKSFEVWANKRNVSGSQSNTEAQQQWQYDTTFTIRYDTRVKSNFTVDDQDGARWLINSIEVDNEGYKGLMLLRCSKSDINIDIS